jgi:O-antigen/teichoic acid export membrane protein
MFTNLQLRTVQATDARGEFRFGHYWALRWLGTAVALIVAGCVCAVAGYSREASLVVVAVALTKGSESFSDLIYGFWQNHERFDLITIAMTTRGIASLAALACALAFGSSLFLSVLALGAVWVAALALFELPVTARMLTRKEPAESHHACWEKDRLHRLAVLALPLGLVAILASLNTNLPRYFVERQLGQAQLGYFSALSYVVIGGGTIIMALGQSISPRLAQYFVENRAAFIRLIGRTLLLVASAGAAGVTVAIWAGRPILRVLYRPEYAEHAGVLSWLMIGGAVNYLVLILVGALTAARSLRVQVPVYASSLTVITLGCWLWVPGAGLTGAAWAVLAGAFATFIGSVLSLVKTIGRGAV